LRRFAACPSVPEVPYITKNYLDDALDHFCIAIEDFKADAIMNELNRQGLKPRRPSGTDRIYFPDPDEIEVQVSAVDHHA
jgi:hypothetical protein